MTTMDPQDVLGPSYVVHRICGCVVMFGPVPVDDFSALAKTLPRNAYLSPRLGSLMGATFVMGTKDNLAELEKLNLPISAERRAWAAWALGNGTPSSLEKWFLRGDHGSSSLVMARVLIDASIDKQGVHHPQDAFDLQRCVDFFRASGLPREALDRMSGVSAEWAALVDHWDELSNLLAQVVPLASDATQQRRAISARMDEIYRQARQEQQRPEGNRCT